MSLEETPLERGAGEWAGVVMIERPDITRMPFGVDPMCRVMSARTVQLAGRRAIYERVPYSAVGHLFRSDDGDHIFCEAEFKVTDEDGAGHLELYGRARTNLKEWVMFSMTQAQAGGKVFTDYI